MQCIMIYVMHAHVADVFVCCIGAVRCVACALHATVRIDMLGIMFSE